MCLNAEYTDRIHLLQTSHGATEHADEVSKVRTVLKMAVDCTNKLVSVSLSYQTIGKYQRSLCGHQDMLLRVELSCSAQSIRWSE